MPELASAGIRYLAACSTKMPDNAFGFSGMTLWLLPAGLLPFAAGLTLI